MPWSQEAQDRQTRAYADAVRIEDLKIAVRSAVSFTQGRHPSHDGGHAVMVIAALR